MMKTLIILFFSLIITSDIISQDEYEKNKTKERKPIYDRSDSIDIAPKSELAGSENDKAYKGMSGFKRNLRLGGAFNFGSYYYENGGIPYAGQLLALMISPQMTHVLSEYFEGGLSTSYTYNGSFGMINSHSFSAGPILRAYPIPDIFFQVEGVGYYNTQKVANYPSYTTIDFNAFVGGGLVSRFSETSYMLTGIKINLIKNELTNEQIIPSAFTSFHFGLW